MKINFIKIGFCVSYVCVMVTLIGLCYVVFEQQKTIVDLNQEMIGNTESVNYAHQNIKGMDSRFKDVGPPLSTQQLSGLITNIVELKEQNDFLREENRRLTSRPVEYSAQEESDCNMSSIPVMLFPIYDKHGNEIFYCDVECSHPSSCFISCSY